MKKIALVVAGLFIHFSGFGQKGLFTGMYNNSTNKDTSVSVFMSYDSVKLVRSTRIRNSDMWLQFKCGTWVIKSDNPDWPCYTITFRFNDGTSEDVIFCASYHERFPGPSTPPDFYTLYIGHMHFGKIFGKGSAMERGGFYPKSDDVY